MRRQHVSQGTLQDGNNWGRTADSIGAIMGDTSREVWGWKGGIAIAAYESRPE